MQIANIFNRRNSIRALALMAVICGIGYIIAAVTTGTVNIPYICGNVLLSVSGVCILWRYVDDVEKAIPIMGLCIGSLCIVISLYLMTPEDFINYYLCMIKIVLGVLMVMCSVAYSVGYRNNATRMAFISGLMAIVEIVPLAVGMALGLPLELALDINMEIVSPAIIMLVFAAVLSRDDVRTRSIVNMVHRDLRKIESTVLISPNAYIEDEYLGVLRGVSGWRDLDGPIEREAEIILREARNKYTLHLRKWRGEDVIKATLDSDVLKTRSWGYTFDIASIAERGRETLDHTVRLYDSKGFFVDIRVRNEQELVLEDQTDEESETAMESALYRRGKELGKKIKSRVNFAGAVPLTLIIVAIVAAFMLMHTPLVQEYEGANEYSIYQMDVQGSDFNLTIERWDVGNCSVKIYQGQIVRDEYLVTHMESNENFLNSNVRQRTLDIDGVPLSEYVDFKHNDEYYLIDNTLLSKNGSFAGSKLEFINAEINSGKYDMRILRGTTSQEFGTVSLLEHYSNGRIETYAVGFDDMSGLDPNKAGLQDVIVTYGEDRTATIQVMVCGFISGSLSREIPAGLTFDEAVEKEYIIIEAAEGVTVTSPDWDSSTPGCRVVTITCEDGTTYKQAYRFVEPDQIPYFAMNSTLKSFLPLGTELPVFTVYVVTEELDLEIFNSNDPGVTITGYDPNRTGVNVIEVSKDGRHYRIPVFLYDDEHASTVEMRLVKLVNEMYVATDEVQYYEDSFITGNLYVELRQSNGGTKYLPFEQSSIIPSGRAQIDYESRKVVKTCAWCVGDMFKSYIEVRLVPMDLDI